MITSTVPALESADSEAPLMRQTDKRGNPGLQMLYRGNSVCYLISTAGYILKILCILIRTDDDD